jgi:hypothetical protein
MKGVVQITHILRRAEGGIDACIEALRGEEDELAQQFLDKWDSISPSDRDALSIEEIATVAEVPTKKLLGVIIGALTAQSAMSMEIIVAASKPKIVQKNVDMAMLAEGDRDREFYLKHINYIPRANGLAVNVDARTQNNVLNAPDSERALPPPSADSFLLELQSTFRPDQKVLEAPLPEPVDGDVPVAEYVIDGDVR